MRKRLEVRYFNGPHLESSCGLFKGGELLIRLAVMPCRREFLFLVPCILSELMFTNKVCYDKVGCFKAGGPWRSLPERPFYPPPESPSEVNVTVTFFTRNTGPRIEDGITANIIGKIDFNDRDFDARRNKTFFIIHGFIDTRNRVWVRTMKDELLKKEDANVFIVDWGNGIFDFNHYRQAASNTRVAGAEIGRFIKYLKSRYNLQPAKIHLIGHSLGAHIASYAAKSIKGIGRITGLDPAQPGFEDMPKEVRLDKSDALFVDVYHTNIRPFFPSLGFGMINPVGDVDIYFNGGYEQPGCGFRSGPKIPRADDWTDVIKIPYTTVLRYFVCSHNQAYEYFTASINSKGCDIWAGKVKMPVKNSITSVTFGRSPIYSVVKECSLKTCTVAGYKADTAGLPRRGVFAAVTVGENAPFCARNHEKMLVNEKMIVREGGIEINGKLYTESSTGEESTIETSSEISYELGTIENDVLDKHADNFMSISESESQYFDDDVMYEAV